MFSFHSYKQYYKNITLFLLYLFLIICTKDSANNKNLFLLFLYKYLKTKNWLKIKEYSYNYFKNQETKNWKKKKQTWVILGWLPFLCRSPWATIDPRRLGSVTRYYSTPSHIISFFISLSPLSLCILPSSASPPSIFVTTVPSLELKRTHKIKS